MEESNEKNILIILAVAVVTLLCVNLTLAESDVAKKFGIFGSIGGSQYSEMYGEDGDEEIREGAPELNGGVTGQGGVIFRFNKNLQWGAEIGYSSALAEQEAKDYSGEWKLPLLETGLRAQYLFDVLPECYLGLGASANFLFVNGVVDFTSDDPDYDTDPNDYLQGSDLGYKFFLTGQYFITDNIALGGEVGYRLAKVKLDAFNKDGKKINPDDYKLVVDYSGMLGQVNMYFYF